MAATHGKKSVFKLDNGSAVLVDISSSTTDVSYPTKLVADEVTTQGGTTDKAFIQGLRERTISITGIWSTTLDAQIQTLQNALAAGTIASAMYEYGPAGSVTTMPKFSGVALLTTYEVNAPVGNVVTFKLDLQVSGNHTVGAY